MTTVQPKPKWQVDTNGFMGEYLCYALFRINDEGDYTECLHLGAGTEYSEFQPVADYVNELETEIRLLTAELRRERAKTDTAVEWTRFARDSEEHMRNLMYGGNHED